MLYTYLSFAQAKTQVAQRLGDPSKVFWLDDELGLYVKEALAVWNAAANYFIETGNFTTTAGTAFYDLAAKLPSLCGNTVTDQEQVQLMEYQLIEPVNTSWLAWNGSSQFSMDDLVQALQRRRNQFLEDTGIYIGVPDVLNVDISQEGLVQLDESVMQTRRVAWGSLDTGLGTIGGFSTSLLYTGLSLSSADNGRLITVSGAGVAGADLTTTLTYVSSVQLTLGDAASTAVSDAQIALVDYSQLPRTDLFAANAQMPGWSYTPATPVQYIPYYVTPPTQIQLAPVPSDAGRLHLVSVKAGADLDVSTGVVLGLDDDFISFVRWGALADLLNMEGMAADPVRADYCEKRYREGVELGKITFTAIQISVNGVPIPQMALDDFDNQIAGWQNDSGQPTEVAMGNSTLIALHPVPDTSEYSISVDTVRNAILPTSDSDFIQVGREFINYIINYAVHLACFKLGGVEFQESMPYYEELMRGASEYNDILKANMDNFDVLSDSGNRQQQLVPAMAA